MMREHRAVKNEYKELRNLISVMVGAIIQILRGNAVERGIRRDKLGQEFPWYRAASASLVQTHSNVKNSLAGIYGNGPHLSTRDMCGHKTTSSEINAWGV